jgi:DUF971 family protein
MHSTGIFSWDWFREHATREAELFAEYEAELATRNLSRDAKAR